MVRVREFAWVAGAIFLAAVTTVFVGQARHQSDRNISAELALTPSANETSGTPQVLSNTTVAQTSPAAVTPRPRPAFQFAENVPALRGTFPEIADDGGHGISHQVAMRLRESVPSELFPYFDVFLYVSKAASGPWAQHMFIYHRAEDGHLAFEESVPVSTGRERQEKYFTSTPTGLFELDPHRFDRNHRSHRWDDAPMPWAMFLNFTIHNHLTGVALHSAIGHVADLGRRASGGCVRLPPHMARYLFRRFQKEEAGEVPVFAFDAPHGRTRTDGTLQLAPDGTPTMARGYKVLVVIENTSGGRSYLATLT